MGGGLVVVLQWTVWPFSSTNLTSQCNQVAVWLVVSTAVISWCRTVTLGKVNWWGGGINGAVAMGSRKIREGEGVVPLALWFGWLEGMCVCVLLRATTGASNSLFRTTRPAFSGSPFAYYNSSYSLKVTQFFLPSITFCRHDSKRFTVLL